MAPVLTLQTVPVDHCARAVCPQPSWLLHTLRCSKPAPHARQICDFGYSKHEKYQSAPGSRVGTPAYLAPEVILTTKGKTYDGKVRLCSGGGGRQLPKCVQVLGGGIGARAAQASCALRL